jgi:hypothetical protein
MSTARCNQFGNLKIYRSTILYIQLPKWKWPECQDVAAKVHCHIWAITGSAAGAANIWQWKWRPIPKLSPPSGYGFRKQNILIPATSRTFDHYLCIACWWIGQAQSRSLSFVTGLSNTYLIYMGLPLVRRSETLLDWSNHKDIRHSLPRLIQLQDKNGEIYKYSNIV